MKASPISIDFFDVGNGPHNKENSLISVHQEIIESSTRGYETSLAFFNVPIDQTIKQEAYALAQKVRDVKPSLFILIGIGGSNLGALAIFQAFKGTLYNEQHPELRFYCLDTIDDHYASAVLSLIEDELQNGRRVVVNIITKSGTTTETIVNAALVVQLLKKYDTQYKDALVITTDKGSPLWQLAQKEELQLLEVPVLVGGRYSVFTHVGLFPLALLGIDIDELLDGAVAYRTDELQAAGNSLAAQCARVIYDAMVQGMNIHNTFLFAPELQQLGNWYRQLTGESLGKSGNGITPTVSMGTTDLHSVVQLYLDGPRDTFTTFISVDQPESITVPMNEFSQVNNLVIGKSVSLIKQRTLEGVMAAYREAKRPYNHITLNGTAHSLGYLMMMNMIEIVYLAHLMGVNPFDQPAVELYKQQTRKRLQ